MPTITLRDKQSLFVRKIGNGQPVLLLPGLGMKSHHWLPFVWPLRKQFCFYMPEFRGVGRSSSASFNQPNVFQNHMEDVEDIVAHFELKDFMLVGYSQGASTALHWQNRGGFEQVRAYLHIEQSPCVINRPDWQHGLFGIQQQWFFARFKRLQVLLEPYQNNTMMALPHRIREQLLTELGDIFSRLLGKSVVRRAFPVMHFVPWVIPFIFPVTRVADISAYLENYTALSENYLPGLANCSTPITVIAGAQSPLYSVAGQAAVAEQAQHGNLVVLPRSGHVPLLDQPFAFKKAFSRFLQQHAS